MSAPARLSGSPFLVLVCYAFGCIPRTYCNISSDTTDAWKHSPLASSVCPRRRSGSAEPSGPLCERRRGFVWSRGFAPLQAERARHTGNARTHTCVQSLGHAKTDTGLGARPRVSGRLSFVKTSLSRPARRPRGGLGSPWAKPAWPRRCGRRLRDPDPLPAAAPVGCGLPRGMVAWSLVAALGLGRLAPNADPRSPCPNPGGVSGSLPPPPPPGLIAGNRGGKLGGTGPGTAARGPTRQEKVVWGERGCQSFWDLFHLRFHNPAVPPTERGRRGGRAPPRPPNAARGAAQAAWSSSCCFCLFFFFFPLFFRYIFF